MNDELKENIKETKKLTADLEKSTEKLAIAKEENFEMKVELVAAALGMLMKGLKESVDDWLKSNAEKEKLFTDVADKIKESIEKNIQAIAQQKVIEFKPVINVSLAPLESMTRTLITLVEKINLKPDNSNTDKLAALITTLVERQLSFLDREGNQNDYTEKLESISAGVNRDDRVGTLKVKRDEFKLITEVVPIYKTNTK